MTIGIVTVVPSLVYSLDENRFSLPSFLYSTIDRRKSFSSDLIDTNETMPGDPKLKVQEKEIADHLNRCIELNFTWIPTAIENDYTITSS